MAHRTKINGTSYEIKGGRTKIGGTGYDVKKGRTKVGGTGYDISFGMPASSLPLGSSVFFNVDGKSTEFIVVHQGLPSSMYDSSCNGTWLLKKGGGPDTQVWDSEDSDYRNSDIHEWLNDIYFYRFDNEIQDAIKEVKIPYWYGDGTNSTNHGVKSGANGLTTKVFYLSCMEIGLVETGTYLKYLPVDGVKLDYFDLTNDANDKRACSAMEEFGYDIGLSWDTRSPEIYSPDTKILCGGDGSYKRNVYANVTASSNIRPAFIISSDFDVSSYL